ncbi:PadR family transcriptional regulator [Streptomyces ochraceiscleroticus]|uniref:PadR family transcriptional regulator n=1 Tax=Streptomyces ochraceiscleroticus TaxID=47761 RepID=A0ABW1MV62_9ACTN|nr:PadR family transcriptional regulator [Streptomyces ochraceiscleroticus]
MSLRYALLGLLADEAGSGYELTKKFERSLDRYAWHAKHNQVYQELNRLAADGLAEVVEEGARGRKTYAITEAGRADLRQWLLNPPRNPVVRNEFVLRLFLLFALDPKEARVVLAEYAAAVQRDLDALTALVESADVDPADGVLPDPLAFGHLAAGFGLHMLPASRDWAHWAIAQIDNWTEEGEEKSEAEDGARGA